jgi:arylsulfatase A-like enzyme
LFRYPDRHKDKYADVKIEFPESMADTPENYYRKPAWVKRQRASWHGVDDMYFKAMSLTEVVRDYNRAMLAVDESVAALVKTLKELGLFESTLIVFAGDNGFLFGEHGLIDKRCMYEESIRIPWIVSCPDLYGKGKVVDQMVLNIDLAPTLLEAAGLVIPSTMQGRSFLRLPNETGMPWRDAFLYEYFWEGAFPETPSCLGVRTDRHKYVEYHGVWDTNELYDLEKDPKEMHNRLSTSKRKEVTADEGYEKIYRQLQRQLAQLADEVGARTLPSWKQ